MNKYKVRNKQKFARQARLPRGAYKKDLPEALMPFAQHAEAERAREALHKIFEADK